MSSSSPNVDYCFQGKECMMKISECLIIIGTVIGVLLLIAGSVGIVIRSILVGYCNHRVNSSLDLQKIFYIKKQT
jgi:hypothetical protein